MPERKTILGACLSPGDGHTRITRGEGVCIIGGDQDSHAKAVEVAIKTHEHLERQGSSLRDCGPERLQEAAERAYEDVAGR